MVIWWIWWGDGEGLGGAGAAEGVLLDGGAVEGAPQVHVQPGAGHPWTQLPKKTLNIYKSRPPPKRNSHGNRKAEKRIHF